MPENKIILKDYKLYKKKYKSANIIKRFENDDYLIETLKKNSISKNDNKILQEKKEIKNLISYIYKKILFENDPKINKIKEENNEFKKEFKIILENLEKSSNIKFKNLIKEYYKRGYKIPNISHKDNLFKKNVLIEKDNDRIELLLKEDIKNEYPKKATRTMNYLGKIKYLIKYILNKDCEEKEDISKIYIPKNRQSFHINESDEDLKKSIEKLKLLIKTLPLMNKEKKVNLYDKKKLSFISSKNIFNSKSILSNKDYSILKNNSNSNSIKTKKSVVFTDSAFTTIDKNNDRSNFLTFRTKSNISNKSYKSSNSSKDIVNKTNKTKQKEFLFFSDSDNQNNLDIISNKNSKHLINLKAKNILINIKENNLNTINNEDKDKESFLYNKNFNTIDLYNKNNLNKLYNNNKVYSNTYTYPFAMSLKKTLKVDKKSKIQKIKNIQKLNRFIRSSFFLSKNKKLKEDLLDKTPIKKRNFSRNINNKIFNIKNSDKPVTTNRINDKTQDEYLQYTYKRLRYGNFKKIEKIIRKYLKEIKHMKKKEEDLLINN